MLGAQTDGMIGYLIEQELGNLLPFEKPLATILTMTEVDPDDPAMADPSKFVGPVYDEAEATRLAAQRGWAVKPDGDRWRRVVPSPLPQRIFQIRPVKWLLDKGAVVICAGGGGIPTMYLAQEGLDSPTDRNARTLVGVEAVIDKDRSSAVLAKDLEADLLVIATDAAAVFLDWGTPGAARHRHRVAGRHGAVRVPRRLDGPEGRGGLCLRARRTRQGRGDRRAGGPDGDPGRHGGHPHQHRLRRAPHLPLTHRVGPRVGGRKGTGTASPRGPAVGQDRRPWDTSTSRA